MKALIVLVSYHHKNTEKIAQVISKAIDAEIRAPQEIVPNSLASYDLVGFGSGIYFGKLDKKLQEFAEKVPQAPGKKAFIISTSGRTGKNATKFHKSFKESIESKGYVVAAEFNCGGFDTYGLLKIRGGINKGRPNEDDIKQAEIFAQKLAKSEPTTVFVE